MLTAFTAILVIMYAWLFRQYTRGWKSQEIFNDHTIRPTVFISVIIAARNEENNIGLLLSSLSMQSYPSTFFEIIIVDDHSTDSTKEKILSGPPSNLKLIEQEQGIEGKKKAIEKGISLSKGELIVTTDADCLLPAGWLESIAGIYETSHAKFIAAPVKFNYDDSFVQKFQALDFMMLQGLTTSGIALDLHYMCNGANLAFSRNAFYSVHGYSGIDKIATGDDMLLMHKIKKSFPGEVKYLKSPDAIVETSPMLNWKDFFMQRKRWASKTFIYDDWRIIGILAFVYLFNTWFFVLLINGFYKPWYLIYALVFVLAKALIEWSYLKRVATFYKEEKLPSLLFLYQPLHIFYTVFVGAWSQVGNYEWKGRKTK